MKKLFIVLCAFSSTVFVACSQSDSPISTNKAATYYGESQPFGGDSIRSWIKTDQSGNPSSIGVTFSHAAFVKTENANADSMFMMMLPTSSGAMLAAPFDHIEVDWTKDHSDPSPYDVAHFDVHFFTVTEAAQNAVMAGMDNATMTMDTNYLPSGYELMMNAEAMMGVHAMDTTDHDKPFNHTCMFGYSQGNLYFMEPMFAKSYLDNTTNYSAAIRQPKKFKTSGWYPTKYNLTWDGTNFSISIDNFISH